MQYLLVKDKQTRVLASKLEWKQRLFNLLSKNEILEDNIRLSAVVMNTKYSWRKTWIQSRNRCIETGRARAIFKRMGLGWGIKNYRCYLVIII